MQGEYEKAIESYEKSLLEDKLPAVEEQLREVKREKQKKEELAYIDPEMSLKHRERGNEFFNKGEFAEALKQYEEAKRRNPNDAIIYNNAAMCFIKIMKFNEALKEVTRALEINPSFIKAMIRKASIHNSLKEYHKALDMYKKVLELEP